MIEVYFRDFGREPKGVSLLPAIPRIGERIIIMLKSGQDVVYQVIGIDYEHFTPRDSEGNLIYAPGPCGDAVRFGFESVVVVVEVVGGENPADFLFSPPLNFINYHQGCNR